MAADDHVDNACVLLNTDFERSANKLSMDNIKICFANQILQSRIQTITIIFDVQLTVFEVQFSSDYLRRIRPRTTGNEAEPDCHWLALVRR